MQHGLRGGVATARAVPSSSALIFMLMLLDPGKEIGPTARPRGGERSTGQIEDALVASRAARGLGTASISRVEDEEEEDQDEEDEEEEGDDDDDESSAHRHERTTSTLMSIS